MKHQQLIAKASIFVCQCKHMTKRTVPKDYTHPCASMVYAKTAKSWIIQMKLKMQELKKAL